MDRGKDVSFEDVGSQLEDEHSSRNFSAGVKRVKPKLIQEGGDMAIQT